MRIFYIETSAAINSMVDIRGSEAHHIKNVLRLKPGDPLKLYDGSGSQYDAVIHAIRDDTVEVEVRGKSRSIPRQTPRIMVAQAFLKEKKMDDLVRKLSELGICDWIPFFSRRSIPRPDKNRLAGRERRWQRIAIEAMKQCRRKTKLEIHEVCSLDDVLRTSQGVDLNIVLWENKAVPFSLGGGIERDREPESILVMLGPEGGFTEREIEKIRRGGFITAGLGPRILRAETATLAASTLIQFIFGDMGSDMGRPG
jgi:16S rRNA (uracil1498-N3)-methyltransferase